MKHGSLFWGAALLLLVAGIVTDTGWLLLASLCFGGAALLMRGEQ